VNAFDRDTGLLKDGERFYEGTKWNYSFRLMHDMDARMALAGGKEAFSALADRFFGFSHPEDGASCCFEGFNNETDMESPYVYHFSGRHDRLSQVIRAGLSYMFAEGRGGLPGNNDSGGLSSCYLWNALGIFPMAGFDRMFLSVPRFSRAVLHLHNGNDLTIRREGDGDPVRVLFGGEDVGLTSFPVTDMMRGGELVFYTA
jgi:putative alpha-1,2-mannosidase